MNRDLRHAVLATVFAIAFIAISHVAFTGIPIVRDNVGALVALVFLYLPIWIGKRRGEDLDDYGFHKEPIKKGLWIAGCYLLVVIPLFVVGFVLFYNIICTSQEPFLTQLAPPGFCNAWKGLKGAHWPSIDFKFLEFTLGQLIVIALPEELFFRGFVHELCEKAFPPKRRFLGGGIGWALVISSALFAVGHLAVGIDPRRLTVFFPGLVFGWMRSATGSILAGTLAHFASNVAIHLLQKIFL